ncbi:MAG: hypothetical protein AB4372_09640 [Xenococcus sp. (in: cyanobacteria)]
MSGHQPFSNLEKRTDMYLAHLREVINAMGGELDITARFGDLEIKITNFDFLNRDRHW